MYLSHTDLPENVNIPGTFQGNLHYTFDRYFEPVERPANANAGETMFNVAFVEAVQISPYLLLTFQDSTIAVFYESEQGIFPRQGLNRAPLLQPLPYT